MDTTFEALEELVGSIGVVTELQAWLLVLLCLAAFAFGACIREYMMEHSQTDMEKAPENEIVYEE